MNRICIWSSVFILLFTTACLKDKTSPVTSGIKLKWIKSHQNDAFDEAIIGLEWAFSHIGAGNSQALYQMQIDSTTIFVDLNQLDFPQKTFNVLLKLNETLILSEEYEINRCIDLGRYVTLLIGASEHYYTFVDMPKTFDDLASEYSLVADSGYIDNSFITDQHRIIRFSEQNGLNQLFVTEERDPTSGALLGIETIDLMENGQLRFGIFTAEGNLKNAADPTLTEAGKPAKCMWCHESGIQPLFGPQTYFEGYLTSDELNDTLLFFKSEHEDKQALLSSAVDYSNPAEHVYMELVYIAFMEPSAERLAREWNMSISKVEELLTGISTHEHEEFPFLGELYFRDEIKAFAPYQSLEVSSSVREKSEVEVNYLE